jgi:hypothetical protein
METLKRLITIKSNVLKSPFDYESYKYEDIRPEWIIHQGRLQYLYDKNFLNDSLCKFQFSKNRNIFFCNF